MQVDGEGPALPSGSPVAARWTGIAPILGGGLFLIAAILLLVVWTIIDRRASAHRTAEIAAVNLSQTLADNFAHTIEKIDFGLRGVLDELADQRKRGSWDEQRILENIARQDQRNPNSVGFRIFGADGKRRFGVSTINSREADLSEREDFKYLRDHPEIGLFVSPPVFGITAQQWIIVVARRITEADGSFGGTVYGPIPIKNLIKAFSTLDLGRGGVVALYHTNLQLAARFPVVNGPEDPLGKVVINDQFRAAIGLGLPEAQFDYTAAVDGVRRLAHVRKIPGQPYYILVGFAEDDYLAEWRSETVHIVIAAAVMIALVLLAMRILLQRMGERRRSVEQLEQSEKFKQAIIDSVAPEIVVLDRQGVIAAVNEPWRDFLARNGEISGRYPPNIGIGANYLAACQASAAAGSNDAARALAGIGAVLDGRKPVFRMEHSTDWPRDKRWYSIVVLPLGKYAEDGVVITQTDVSRLKSAEADLRIAAAAFEAQEGMMITDANEVILQVNQAFCDNTGYEAADVIGHTPRLLKSGRHDKAFYAAMWASIDKTGKWQGEICGRRKDGQLYPEWLTITAVRGPDGAVANYIGIHHDMSERRRAEEQIATLAFFDQLTGLPNRILLIDRLKQAMASRSHGGGYGGLLFIDMDNFKTLNDTQGHDIGDLLLKEAAQRLADCVCEGDTVGRLGGDEFVVILIDAGRTEEEAASAVEGVAERILASISQTFSLGSLTHVCTASIGACLFKGNTVSFDDLMKQADLAMYRAKDSGRNVCRFFDPHMQAAMHERAEMEGDLRQAVTGNQFTLFYQAQMGPEGRLTGAEALIRWQHPRRGTVLPGDFIPLAEATGLILPIGSWVLETACGQLAQWAEQPRMAALSLAVNVSAHQFRQTDFIEQVLAVLTRTGANPRRLKLELTESLLVDNVQDVIEKMSALQAAGLSFALDDFGTGYSSLSYLKRLPLNQLKIDQSFIRDVFIDPNDATITRTIVGLAKSFQLGVIAEGVETAEQRDLLAAAGCHSYQGYFFSRPLPLADFERFVAICGNAHNLSGTVR